MGVSKGGWGGVGVGALLDNARYQRVLKAIFLRFLFQV